MPKGGIPYLFPDNVKHFKDMKRRNFVKTGALASGVAFTATGAVKSMAAAPPAREPFTCDFAPHFGMFKHSAGENMLDQLDFMAEVGFRSLEDNGMKGRSVEDQKAIAQRMEKHNMRMGVFVAHKIYWQEANLASGDQDKREEFLNDIRTSVEVAKRVNATWMTVVPGHVDLRQNMGYQTSNVIESLKQASAILEPHGMVMVLEPLNFRNHPGLFLTESPQAYQICKAVDSPSCKILFDIYHQQIQEGNLIPNIQQCWDEIGYFQIGDNPGRNEPTSGEINYKNVFKVIHEKDFKGIYGMEHGNAKPGKEGEEALIAAYRSVDAS